MRIKVFFPHNTRYVDTSELSSLIKRGKIMAFEREHKLTVVGIHPTRQGATKIHPGDRRKA